MSVTVNKLDYIYKKLLHEARQKMNDTVEISEKEYELYYGDINEDENNDYNYSQDYLTFEALEDGTFSFTINDLYYSINNGQSWKSLVAGEQTELITAGSKVLWKRDNEIKPLSYTYGDNMIGTFSSTGKFNCFGNILSLFYINNFSNYNILPKFSNPNSPYTPAVFFTCSQLFKNCINLISVKNLILPTELNDYCFCQMFYGCTSLTTAPELLASSLISYGYYYQEMFYNCSSLNYVKCLASNIGDTRFILADWLKNVAPSGIFIKHPNSSWNIGDSGIPVGWEVIDAEIPEE